MKINPVLGLCLIINLLFPVLGIILVGFYFLMKKNNNLERRLVFLSISFSMAIIGYLYLRVNESGDVYRYALTLYYYKYSMLSGSRVFFIENLYEFFYPSWYLLYYITISLGENIQFINFICGFSIYYSFLYVIKKMSEKYKAHKVDKIIFVRFFLFIPFIVLFSSYRNLCAFSIVSVGIYFLMNKKEIKGYFFLILGAGFHPIAIIPIIIFFLSKYIVVRSRFVYFSLMLGVMAKYFLSVFNSLLNIPFLGGKINNYIYGEWSQYRFHERGEYLKILSLLCLVSFVFFIIKLKLINFEEVKDNYLKRYNNFILLYFSISLWFLSFRTIETRLLLDGFVFFTPLFYQVFKEKKVYKKHILYQVSLFFWFFMIDLRILNVFNNSFIIGQGIPYNIFQSPIISFFFNLIT